MGEKTTIQIDVTTWQELNGRKLPNDSFDDVIQQLLQETKDTDSSHSHETTATIESQPNSDAPERGSKEIPLPDDVPDRINPDDARAAIRAAIDYVEANDGATMREIVTDVMPDHSLGYDVPDLSDGGRYRGSWWRKVVRPALQRHPDIAKPAQHESLWRVTDFT